LLSKRTFDLLINTIQPNIKHHVIVVICFQNVPLTYW